MNQTVAPYQQTFSRSQKLRWYSWHSALLVAPVLPHRTLGTARSVLRHRLAECTSANVWVPAEGHIV